MSMKSLLSTLAALVVASSLATAQTGPDVIAFRIGFAGSNANDIHYYGQSGGIAAYSFATQSCNIGTADLMWFSGGVNHPVISQNIFRLKGRRFEQLGQSWLKHAFCALCEGGCGNGTGAGCASWLFVGCADTYWATLNDGSSGGPKFTVDPVSGTHVHPDPSATGPSSIRGRLQVPVSEIDPALNPGASYFIEGGYIASDDHANSNSANNSSWRAINVNTLSNITGGGPTEVGEVALEAWRAQDPAVEVVHAPNLDEGGSGVDGHYFVAYRTWDNGNGTWDYSYAVENLTSEQGAASFAVPSGPGVNLTNVWFTDVDYHSGELQNGVDWGMSQTPTAIEWACTETFAVNPNANALNWGTAYSFGFTADAPPQSGVAELAMFEPGVGGVLTVPVDGPGQGPPPTGVRYCSGDLSGTPCPCGNNGGPGAGCQNSNGGPGASLGATGTPSVGGDNVSLQVTGAVGNEFGLFFQANNRIAGGNGSPFGDGLRCAGGGVVRLQVVSSNGSGAVSSTVPLAQTGGVLPSDVKRYQYWYRDPVASPCLSAFNLSNGFEITWTP